MLAYNVKRVILRIKRENKLDDLLKCIFYELRNTYYYPIVKKSWSPNGEDRYVSSLIPRVKKGFYIDIGAHSPKKGSNTYAFYKQGWMGITIDPNTTYIDQHKLQRPRDLSLNIGIADNVGKMKFYQMFPDSLSTFSKSEVDKNIADGFKLVSTKIIEVDNLKNILDKHLNDVKIDFLNVDTEGLDYIVLQGNNWTKYRPTVICVEVQEDERDQQIKDLLEGEGYSKNKNLGNNFIYVLNKN